MQIIWTKSFLNLLVFAFTLISFSLLGERRGIWIHKETGSSRSWPRINQTTIRAGQQGSRGKGKEAYQRKQNFYFY